MQLFKSVLKSIDATSQRSGKAFSFLILAIMVLVIYEVVMRLLNVGVLWAVDVGSWLFGVVGLGGGAYVLYHNEHIKVDLIYSHLPRRARAIVDSVTFALFFLFVGIILWKSAEKASESVANLERTTSAWSAPLYPMRIIVVILIALLLLQGIAKFVRDFTYAVKGGARE